MSREIARQKQGVLLADDSVRGVRAVEPVHADSDEWIIHRPELLDRLVRPREIALDSIGVSPQFFERLFQLHRGPFDVR